MNKLVDTARSSLSDAIQKGSEAAADIIQAGQEEASTFIKDRLNKMTAMVDKEEANRTSNSFVGINEEAILSYVHDKRSISGVAPLLLGIFLAVALPDGWGFLSLLFFMAFLASAFYGYVWQSKVDIPEGYDGVVCLKGAPDETVRSHTGRNWMFNILRFIPFRVATKRDQVVKVSVANFTRGFASIRLTMQIVFRVSDPGKFITDTSPALAMTLMQTYANYIALRMITSVEDARVKFTGRDKLDNVAAELNRYLSRYGITVLQVTMPETENGILEDLEEIRIKVKETDMLKSSRTVRLESALKSVESTMRRTKKEALAKAQELQNMVISFKSAVASRINAMRQQLTIDAQRQVTTNHSKLQRAVSMLKARTEKAKAIATSIPRLEQSLDIRLAELKERAAIRMLPKRIVVMGVTGIGTGVGLGMGTDVLKSLLAPPAAPATIPAESPIAA